MPRAAFPLILAAFLTAIVVQIAPVPPPIAQATADCSRPTYATDMLVCDDPALKAIDDRLKSALAAAPMTEVGTPLIEDQAAWFRRSRRCAFQTQHRACISDAYSERLSVLAFAAPAPPAGQCLLSDKTAATFSEVPGGAALLWNGRLISVGMVPTPPWQPFVTYRPRGNSANFRDLSGRSVATCRFATQKGQR